MVGAAVGAEEGSVKFRAFRARGQSRNSGIVGKGFDNAPHGGRPNSAANLEHTSW